MSNDDWGDDARMEEALSLRSALVATQAQLAAATADVEKLRLRFCDDCDVTLQDDILQPVGDTAYIRCAACEISRGQVHRELLEALKGILDIAENAMEGMHDEHCSNVPMRTCGNRASGCKGPLEPDVIAIDEARALIAKVDGDEEA